MIPRRRLLLELIVLAGAGLVIGALGPLGSYPMPVAKRLALWALFLLAGYVCFRPVIAAGSALGRSPPELRSLGLVTPA